MQGVRQVSHRGTQDISGTTGREILESLAEWRGETTFNLDKILRVLRFLGNPQDAVPVVHVAGTNGKGSVSASCAAILGAAGKKVGMTISPHLTDLSERVLIDGLPLSGDLLDTLAHDLAHAMKAVATRLSFHEGMTALAFLAFRECKVDIGVLEVGLGGRLDSTNVVRRTEVAVITSIGYDHCEVLGHTLAAIAREKAGIIKAKSPVVTGDLVDEALNEVAQAAAQHQAPLWTLGRDFYMDTRGAETVISLPDGTTIAAKLALAGRHQRANAAVAATACHLLGVSSGNISSGLANVAWPGRFERIIHGKGVIILDAAHNVAGIEALTQLLGECNYPKLDAVAFGALTTKDWRAMAQMLIPYAQEAEWLVGTPLSTQAVASEVVTEYLSGNGIRSTSFDTRYEELATALQSRVKNGGVALLAGSIYLLGRVRPHLVALDKPVWTRGDAIT